MSRSGLSRADGTPTGATYGFTTEVLRLLKEIRPTHAAVVFDTPGETFRHRIYAEYKATRSSMPEELVGQLDLIRETTEALGVKFIALPGCEADDLVASIAVKGAAQVLSVWIVTGDKDFLQLVNDRIKVYQLSKPSASAAVIDRAGVIDKFGVPPERVIDVLALMGDSVDNIPGVRGIGEKTAVKLIQDYGDLETVLAKAAEIKPKGVAEKILANLDMARLSQELATIHIDVPLPYSPTDLAPQPRDAARL